MRRISSLSVIGMLALGACAAAAQTVYEVPPDVPEPVRAAVESADRPAADRERDASRKPAEILAMSGVEPGDHVVEFAGFGQYYTRMLVRIVGAEGRVDVYDLPYTEQFAGDASRAFAESLSNVEYHQQDYDTIDLPSRVDAVFNVLYYHDLGPQGVDTAALNEKIYAALRPGGRYVVVDHEAAAGSGWSEAESLHRIEASTIVDEVTAAGFELAVDSDLLANPDDGHTQNVFADEMRGRTDRAVLVFARPESE